MSTAQRTPIQLDSLDDVVMSVPESVLSQELDGEVVLLDVANGEYYGLDDVGTYIWVHLQENLHAPEKVVDAVVSKYQIDRNQADADIRGFIGMLVHFDLMHIVPDPGT